MILLALSAAWLAGLIAAAVGLGDYALMVALTPAGTAIGFFASGRPLPACLALACAGVAVLGVLRYESGRPPAGAWGIGVYNGETVLIRGVIDREPEERLRSQRLTVRVEEFQVDGEWLPSSGRVQVTTRLFPVFEYGDRLELRGKLEEPPAFDSFDYRDYLARQGIVSLSAFPSIRRLSEGHGNLAMEGLIAVRGPMGRALQRALPEPEAALARGILLGQRTSIPRDLTEDFNRAGISHLVAISGYNVTLVVGLVVGSLAWAVGRRRATFLAAFAVVFFVFLVGADPSVMRAGLMGLLVLGANLLGRPGHALTAVAFAGALLTLLQPLTIHDAAFQLSFAATFGLILFSRDLTERIQAVLVRFLPPSAAAALGENLGVTAASTIAVLPIIGASFGRISLVALPANVFAVPAFTAILVMSAVTAVVGTVSPALAAAISPFAQLPLSYMVLVGRVAAAVPGAAVEVSGIGVLEAALVYIVIGLVTVAILRTPVRLEPVRMPRLGPLVPASVLATVVAGAVAIGMMSNANDRLVVTVLDVGQGDAILIETPAGHRILVDGGPSGTVLAQALGRAMPASARRIDLIVLTHAQDDHVTGLYALTDRYQVGAILAGPLEGQTAAYRAWRELVASKGIPMLEARAGTAIDIGGGAVIEVLWPPERPLLGTVDDLNNNSVVLRLVYGGVSILLTGDIATAAEEAIVRTGDLRSTVLKVAHHGSDLSNTPPFLTAVGAQIAIVSAGEANNFGHPSPTTLLRLAGIPIYRTDRNGNVRIETDGERIAVRVERGQPQLVPPPVGALVR